MNGFRRFLHVRPGRLMALMAVMAFSLLMGCSIAPQQNPYLYTGAGLGAATGAALGAGINHRNPWKGAAIGGLLGTAIGGVAGEAYGRSNPYPPYQSQPQGYYQPPQQQPQGYYQQPYYQPSS
jgi:Glycine zipper